MTCGKAVLIKTRVCRDSLKLELAERSNCIKDVGDDNKQRITVECDMGPCETVNKVEVFFEKASEFEEISVLTLQLGT